MLRITEFQGYKQSLIRLWNLHPLKTCLVCVLVHGRVYSKVQLNHHCHRYRINTTLSERVSHLNTPWNHPEHSSSSRQYVSTVCATLIVRSLHTGTWRGDLITSPHRFNTLSLPVLILNHVIHAVMLLLLATTNISKFEVGKFNFTFYCFHSNYNKIQTASKVCGYLILQ